MHKHHHKRSTPAHTGPTGPTTTTVASVDETHNAPQVSAEDIQLCAYRKWEAAGKPAGDGIQFWLEAEQELSQAE